MGVFKKWLVYLTDKDGRSYQYKDGAVSKTGVPTPIPVGPDGLDETAIKYTRSARYFGMFRSYTTPLKFVEEGAKILRHVFYTFGYEETLNLIITRLDTRFGMGFIHKLFYRGEIDLAKTEDEEITTTVNVMEGDIDRLIKAGENTRYEIPLGDTQDKAVLIGVDGIKLRSTGTQTIVPELVISKRFYNTSYTLPTYDAGTEGQAPGISYKGQSLQSTGNSVDYVNDSPNWIALNTNPEPVDVVITGVLKVRTVANDFSGGFSFRFMTSKMTTANQDDYNFSGIISAGPPGTDNEIPVDITVPLAEGEQLFLRGAFIGGATGALDLDLMFLDGSELKLSTVARKAVTYVNGLTPMDLGQIILDRMTGGGYTLVSTVLSGDWKGLLVTSGDALRGFNNAKLKTSWADFYDSFNSVLNLDLFFKGNEVHIEPKAQAFGALEVLDLGDVKGLKVRVAEDHVFNNLKIGYPNSQLEDTNGKDDYNNTFVWGTPTTKIVKDLDLVSKYSASIYDIEFTRLNYENKESTNGQTDDTVFFIHCEKYPVLHPSGIMQYYPILRNVYDSLSGIAFPDTAFNLEISPKSNLLRHGNYLHAAQYFVRNGQFKFITSSKNSEMVRVAGGVTISERGPEVIRDLAAPLFIPLTFDFNGPIPIEIIEIMETNPAETFIFTWSGLVFKGFPLEVGIRPYKRPAMDTTLLCGPGVDITKLINI